MNGNSLNNKYFKALVNSDNGEVSEATIFHYRQRETIIWATYEGGDVLFGTLSGRRDADTLVFTYQHQNQQGEFMTGQCSTIINVVDDKLQLHETWQWTCRDHSSGTSILEEVGK